MPVDDGVNEVNDSFPYKEFCFLSFEMIGDVVRWEDPISLSIDMRAGGVVMGTHNLS